MLYVRRFSLHVCMLSVLTGDVCDESQKSSTDSVKWKLNAICEEQVLINVKIKYI